MIVAAFLIIPADEVHPISLADFDFLGCITGVSGLVLFNFAWNQAAVVGWSTVYTYVLLIVGLLLLVAFVLIEVRYAKNPLVPLNGFKGEAALALSVIAAGWGRGVLESGCITSEDSLSLFAGTLPSLRARRTLLLRSLGSSQPWPPASSCLT